MPNEIILVERGFDLDWVMLPDGTIRKPFNRDDWFYWNRLSRILDYKHIAQTWVGDMRISTIFLGMDHGIDFGAKLVQRADGSIEFEDSPGYKPTLFETMIFGGALHGYQRRYKSLRQARFGHKRAVLQARSKLPDDEIPCQAD